MATAIVTFASSNLSHMGRRFRRQAKKMQVFDQLYIWSEKNLDLDFRREFQEKLKASVTGYGYWVWKPQVILQALKRLQEGDFLVYLDTGSHLNTGGTGRLNDYLEAVRESSSGILAFQLELPESDWCKEDLLVRMEQEYPPSRDSNQVQAGAIVFHKRGSVVEFVEKWASIFREDFSLVDDTPSALPNGPNFRAHRHDQAVFSLLAKGEGIELLSASEQFPGQGSQWADLRDFPFHHRRDKKTKSQLLWIVAKRRSLPLQRLLVRTKARVIEIFRRLTGRK